MQVESNKSPLLEPFNKKKHKKIRSTIRGRKLLTIRVKKVKRFSLVVSGSSISSRVRRLFVVDRCRGVPRKKGKCEKFKI